MNHYFITGATGVIGSAFLKRIGQRGARATLLIRADSPRAAERRLERLLAFCDLPRETAQSIDLLTGDLYRPRMGLAQDTYERLAATCTHIVHCAGNVRMNLPLAEARRQTLTATHAVLDLLDAAPHAKKMEFVSTIGVAGHTPGDIPEDWLPGPRDFRNSYEAAKAEAESVVREKILGGRPITIHRPSMVVGDSRSGAVPAFQVFYLLCEFLSGRRTRGYVPRCKGMTLDIVPSDYVAAVLDWSCQQSHRPPTILHLCSGPTEALPLDELSRSARMVFEQKGLRLPPLRPIPVPLFKFLIGLAKPFAGKKNRRALDTLPFFLAYLKERQSFVNTRTQQLLAADGMPLLPVKSYLKTILAYYLSQRPVLQPSG